MASSSTLYTFSQKKNGVIVYPSYINSKKSIAEGRRIAQNVAVENPTVNEIIDVCKGLKLKHVPETDKGYSRDPSVRGRVRIWLRNDDDSLVVPDVDTRKGLYLRISSMIPKLISRNAADSGSGGGGKSKKKKKKGRK